jgi:2-polyprenyl-3-methyl-5-hydroxy-6-metoxy-1,4-benzoquinol methylase
MGDEMPISDELRIDRAVSTGGLTLPIGAGVELAHALVLSESPWTHPGFPRSGVERFDPLELGSRVARASRGAIVLSGGLESLQPDEWRSLIEWCSEALRPDGVLVLRLARGGPVELRSLKALLARRFGAVDVFGWDGLRREPEPAVTTDLFAICRLFLPYAARSLDLLRPRVVTSGPDWQSSWLCEQPALPERFLLRAALDAVGESLGGIDLRLRFVAPERARFKIEGRLDDLASGTVDLLLSSERADARGAPEWAAVERIAIDARTDSEEPVDVRISDVRIYSDAALPPAPGTRTSAHLRADYDAGYYGSMPGYAQYRENQDLREHVNVHRAYALLSFAPERVVDVGSGRGELAQHLIEQGAEVTLLDYSPAAMQFAKTLIGERPGARFVVDDAANLDAHVAEQSQDAIFMTDFVEHLSVEELRSVLRACRRVLAPDGTLIIHTPERYSGSIVTAKAIHGLHVNLFEIETLEALLLETFDAVDVFTWNGFERFHERGRCIELFALARPQPYLTRPLPSAATEGDQAEGAWQTVWVFEHPRLPSRFICEATIDVSRPAAEGELEIAFLSAAGEPVARVARELLGLQTFPVHLRLASELLMPGTPSSWGAVESIVVSVSSPRGERIEIAVSDACLSLTVPNAVGLDMRESKRGPRALLARE